ncbi:MAG: extracellular solute-binding protein [Clostridiales bacterium]|nr:extracellular solute-binding protein [Clostridiales bacterium]
MLNRIYYSTIYVLLCLVMVGCSGDTNGSVDMKANDRDSTTVLTMYSEDLKMEYDSFLSPVAKAITKESGIVLDIEYPTEGISEKMDLLIASNVYPDLIMVKDTHKFVDANAYIDLRPLIEAYGPNIKKLYDGYMNRLQFSNEDNSIYVLPQRPVDEIAWEPEMGFQLQHAVVKALGYPKLETLDDYENAIRSYINMFPEINGEPTIGISFVIDDWRWKISLGNAAGFATGAPDDGNWYVDPVTFETSYRFLREEEKEYYRWLNHMYNDGLIDPESFVQKYESYVAKIASGRVLGLIDAKWQYAFAETILRENNMEERMYGQYPVQLDKSTKAADFRDVGYIGGYGIGISKDCEDPIAAIKFLDFMASDEGHILRLWGIEGEHFYYENGKRVIPPEEMEKRLTDADYFKNTGKSVYGYPFPIWGRGKLDESNNYYNPDSQEILMANYTEIEKEVMAAYDVNTWAELYPTADELPVSLWGEAWDIPIPTGSSIRFQLQECDEIMREGLIRTVLSKPDEFDENWEDIMEQLDRANVHLMGNEFTKLVKARIELWRE